MNTLTQSEGIFILTIFGISMFALVWLKSRHKTRLDGFLVANRNVSLLGGAFSIAVSWVWAPAIFICSMQAYTKGLPGIFWFTVPNILCFFIFVPLGIRLRKLLPDGYTLPEFIYKRYQGDKKIHLLYLIIFFGYQLGAIVINCVAGGTLLNIISGMDIRLAILAMSVISIAYSLLSGLKASIFTDIIQMAMVLVISLVIVPWAIIKSGGWSSITSGFAGVSGEYGNVFNPGVAYSMGIAMTLGLIAGPIGDQMFFQRVFAIHPKNILKTFVIGGLIFGIVPITLSLLGFIGANPDNQSILTIVDPQVVGAVVINHYLPKGAFILFCFMAFAGLSSTLDSAYCALSSLGSIDIYKRYFNANPKEKKLLSIARWTMVFMASIGTGIALLKPRLLWVFLIYGALASAGMFPTILSLFWSRLTSRGVFWAVLLSLGIGTPLSIYANITENTHLIVLAAVASVLIGLLVCLVTGYMNQETRFDFSNIKKTG